MVRGANPTARIVGRTVSADSPCQPRHQVPERDLPHEWLARQIVPAKGPQPLAILVLDAQPYAERAHHNRADPVHPVRRRTPDPELQAMVGILISVADATGERAASEVDVGRGPYFRDVRQQLRERGDRVEDAFILVTRVAAGEPASPLGSDRSA